MKLVNCTDKSQKYRICLPGLTAAMIISILWGLFLHTFSPETPLGNQLILCAVLMLAVYYVLRSLQLLFIRRPEKSMLLVFITIFAFLTAAFFSSLVYPAHVFDNWQIYDIGRFIFSDPGYGNQIRQHIIPTHYEMAFPPIMPLLVGIINYLAPLKVLACPFIMYLFAVLSMGEAMTVYDRADKNKGLILLAFLMFFTQKQYILLVQAGNSVVIGIYLLLKLLNILSGSGSVRRKYGQGILVVSLGLMNRFDFLSIFLLFVVLFPVILLKNDQQSGVGSRILYILAMTVLALAVISPWIVYSMVHFGVPFITDNGRRLINVADTRPATFFPESMPAETIFSNFGGWVSAMVQRIKIVFGSGIKMVFGASLLSPVLLCFFREFYQQTGKFLRNIKFLRIKHLCTEKVLFYLCVLSQEAVVLLTGYPELRYHLSFALFLIIGVLQVFDFSVDRKWYRSGVKVCAVFAAVGCLLTVLSGVQDIRYLRSAGTNYRTYTVMPENLTEADRILTEENATLVVSRANDIDFPQYSALCHHTTTFAPYNLTAEIIPDFVETFQVSHLFAMDNRTLTAFEDSFELIPISDDLPGFYKLEHK